MKVVNLYSDGNGSSSGGGFRGGAVVVMISAAVAAAEAVMTTGVVVPAWALSSCGRERQRRVLCVVRVEAAVSAAAKETLKVASVAELKSTKMLPFFFFELSK